MILEATVPSLHERYQKNILKLLKSTLKLGMAIPRRISFLEESRSPGMSI